MKNRRNILKYIIATVAGTFAITNNVSAIRKTPEDKHPGETKKQLTEKYGVFSDKTIAYFGDSLTEFGDIPERIALRTGANVLKFGFGGCRMGWHTHIGYDAMSMYRIAHAINENNYSRLEKYASDVVREFNDNNLPQIMRLKSTVWSNVDYAVIAFGTNDFGGSRIKNNKIGDINDLTPDGSTFCGSINYVIQQLLSKNPRMRLVFISPIWRLKTPSDLSGINPLGSDETTNINGDHLIGFVDAMIECCKRNHVEVWDGYRRSGINQYTAHAYIADGVHPTDDGYALLADKISAFLESTF